MNARHLVLVLLAICSVARADLPDGYLPELDRFVLQNKICPLADSKCSATRSAYNVITSSGYCLTVPDRPGNLKSWSKCPKPPEELMQIQRSDCLDVKSPPTAISGATETVIPRADQGGKQCSVTCGLPSGTSILKPVDQCQLLINRAVFATVQENRQMAEMEERRKEYQAEQDKIKERQQEAAKQVDDRKSAQDKVYKDLQQNGYVPMTVEDFVLDAKVLPEGKKVYISGVFESSGNMEYLRKISSRIIPNQKTEIPLLSDGASRDTRRHLLSLDQACNEFHGSICNVTIVGKVDACTITVLNMERKATCLAIDSIMSSF